ncbi:MAG: carbon monoxide dehydrogenase [Lachnospiraceae bacterium]|nr:carbon monoxide dehydrogenase [Candidatus Equihabitans merdae]
MKLYDKSIQEMLGTLSEFLQVSCAGGFNPKNCRDTSSPGACQNSPEMGDQTSAGPDGSDAKACDDSSSASNQLTWPEASPSDIIMRSDMAYELGGGTKEALSALTLTEDQSLVPCDQVLVVGDDLPNISQDRAYARLAIVRVRADSLGEGDRMYNNIRGIEYVRYRVRPSGYMVRISSSNAREPVRIAKKALAEGLSFAHVGAHYLKAYHQNPLIEAVKLIFITDEAYDYKNLKALILKNEAITRTIDHALKDLKMDCNTCKEKPLCDEIEGMKELHFGSKKSSG